MGDNLEKATKTILGSDESVFSKSVLNLAISLDRTFTEKDKLAEQRHNEIMDAIKLNQNATEKRCSACKTEVDKKFKSLSTVLYLSENPMALRFVVFLLFVILMLAAKGGGDLITILKNLL